jgi:hypothetical protein
MSSPIHSYLFSPPPSPPLRSADAKPTTQDATRAHGLTSIKSLFMPSELNLMPRPSLDGNNELKIRSPRTPAQRHFTLDTTYPSPSRFTRPTVIVEDTDQIPRSPRIISAPHDLISEKVEAIPANVPSTTIPMSASLPRPLLRLLFLASLIISSVLLLVYVPEARFPSLKAASSSRRLALSTDGRAYYDLAHAVNSFDEALDRDYRPPQVRTTKAKRAALPPPSTDRETAPMPKSTRTAMSSRPLPESHELLALQSYLLQSAYNVLPASIDPKQPLDAHTILNVGKLGVAGGDVEKAWLADLESEREDDIVVWYGADGYVSSIFQDRMQADQSVPRRPLTLYLMSLPLFTARSESQP